MNPDSLDLEAEWMILTAVECMSTSAKALLDASDKISVLRRDDSLGAPDLAVVTESCVELTSVALKMLHLARSIQQLASIKMANHTSPRPTGHCPTCGTTSGNHWMGCDGS